MQITVNSALAAAKKYKKELERVLQIDNSKDRFFHDSRSSGEPKFIGYTVANTGICNGIPLEKAEDEFKGNFQSFMKNYDNLITIRRAITRINAGIVDGKTENILTISASNKLPQMTLAEVIVCRKNLPYLKKFVELLERQYAAVRNTVELKNQQVTDSLNDILKGNGGKDSKSASYINAEEYHKQNDVRLVDPLNLGTCVEELREKVEHLDSVYDAALSNYNAIQTIEIDFNSPAQK